MDPIAIVRLLWKFRKIAVPMLALTLVAVVYVGVAGPKTYESTSSYVIISPKVPTDEELSNNSRLAKLNSDNPYLRSSDPSLVVQVVASRLSGEATAKEAKARGLSTEYTVARSATNSLMIIITGFGGTARQSLDTTAWLSEQMTTQLKEIQKVNGADDLYLMTAIAVDTQIEATEKVSSRLRSLIVVLAGGVVLMFGAVSIGLGLERHRKKKPSTGSGEAPAVPDSGWTWPESATGADVADDVRQGPPATKDGLSVHEASKRSGADNAPSAKLRHREVSRKG